MNLPNSLTVARIFLVPLLVVVLLTKFEGRLILGVPKELVGAAIFGLASLTDWLDGYLARRRKQITPLGQVIDPLADKLLTSAALISLVQMDLAPAWMVAVIIGREFAVTGAAQPRLRARRRRFRRRRSARSRWWRRWSRSCALILGAGSTLQPLYVDRAGGAVGGGGRPRWCRRSTTSAASTRARARASPTSASRATAAVGSEKPARVATLTRVFGASTTSRRS